MFQSVRHEFHSLDFDIRFIRNQLSAISLVLTTLFTNPFVSRLCEHGVLCLNRTGDHGFIDLALVLLNDFL